MKCVGKLSCGCSAEVLCAVATSLWLTAATRLVQYLLATGEDAEVARDEYESALAAYEAHFVADEEEDVDERRERWEDFIPF